jgi:hypothetical protein
VEVPDNEGELQLAVEDEPGGEGGKIHENMVNIEEEI